MKSRIKEILAEQDLSVRKLAERFADDHAAPNYSTIDNFIRKGTGHLDTAWAITRMMGVTLNDAFVDDSYIPEDTKDVTQNGAENADVALKTIIDRILAKGEIKTDNDIAEILLAIGTAITPLGFQNEAAKIIRMGAVVVENAKRGGEDSE